jgi:hypothetical protein
MIMYGYFSVLIREQKIPASNRDLPAQKTQRNRALYAGVAALGLRSMRESQLRIAI